MVGRGISDGKWLFVGWRWKRGCLVEGEVVDERRRMVESLMQVLPDMR